MYCNLLKNISIYRDLGVQIRQHINILTNPSRITSSEYDNYCKQFDSLEKLANNAFGGKCNRIYESSSTGLTVQQCSHVLSSEFLQYLKDKPKQL